MSVENFKALSFIPSTTSAFDCDLALKLLSTINIFLLLELLDFFILSSG